MTKPKIIISGGGTGGHIYPAIAIANQLKADQPQAEILFVGAKDRMEMEKVPKAGYPIEGLWISGLQRKLTLSNLSFPFKLMNSLMKARQIVKKFKPQVAIGVGGYASAPLLWAATQMKIPTLIQEQNAFAGLTNQWLGKKVNKVCVAYEGMEKFFPKEKIIITGNPVRTDIMHAEQKKAEAYPYFQINPNKRTVLVIGGSLGAKSINEAVLAQLNELNSKEIQVIWQTGKPFFSIAQQHLQDNPTLAENIKIHEFIYPMDLAYAAADVIISRAGALAISEICLVAKPSVLVPYPFAAEDHQTKNAQSLAQADAALMVNDKDTQSQLITTALALLEDKNKQEKLTKNIVAFARPEATRQIADEIWKIILG
ncbi:MAG: undecaprenyldiphospho-muramoylpentapeptide beta-N-acetylglucosaminyltransferase [Cytophagales bacterium]|nr:MAG: undecaprenyldiphospho-muramoylpentapeptide beta-N-acetylglucosaminyltransferase [Cytophagales bacterium]